MQYAVTVMMTNMRFASFRKTAEQSYTLRMTWVDRRSGIGDFGGGSLELPRRWLGAQ